MKSKKKIDKKYLSVIITASVLVFLIIAYAVSDAVIGALNNDSPEKGDPPTAMDGEAVSGNTLLAFPETSQANVEGVIVDSHNGQYAMYRSEKENYFFFCYEDENGEMQVYYPKIVGAESEFDYTDLYAVSDLGVYKITYLLSTLCSLAIDQRITLDEDPVVRAQELNRYGLGNDEKETIILMRVDSEGKNVTTKIEIGDKLLAGTGYYYRVDERDYVYTSTGTYIDYALDGFSKLLNANLVAPGIEKDGVYEPYYTTDYKQWKNTVTAYDETKEAAAQALVKKNSKVISNLNVLSPINDDSYYEENGINKLLSNGYSESGYKLSEMDLEALSAIPQYKSLINTFTGSRLGSYDGRELLATVISDTLEIDFGDSDKVKYDYNVVAVESVITSDGEYADAGRCALDFTDAQMIRVTYNYSIGSEKKNEVVRHAVIDLSDEAISPDSRAELASAKIGDKLDISFSVDYSKDTAKQHGMTYVISEIALIWNEGDDGSLSYSEVIGEDSVVTYRYYLSFEGKKVTDEESVTVRISDMTEGDYVKVKTALLGRSVGRELNIEALTDVIYTQSFMDFITYSIKSIEYFVESEIVSSFEFVNASNRDSFHAELLHVNTLPLDNAYRNYALNSTSCEKVVRLLGGINPDSSSENSIGLQGSETVALGITPEVMNKYGLYANTVYFELPRYIEKIKNDDPDALEDYTYLSTLGFTLYISDYNYEEGCRYIASDMYDIVAKVEGNEFDYLDLSFVDFWARRSLVLVKYQNIENLALDFYMDDIYGSYNFDTVCDKIWILNGKHYYSKPETGGQEYDFLTVNASIKGETSGNKLTEYLSAGDSMTLADLYNAVATEKTGVEQWLSEGHDTVGASSFKEMLLLLYNTYYTGKLSAEEQKRGYESSKLMSISFTVSGSAKEVYTYDFYRLDDRRVMVSLYNPGYDNAVSDFYISTFAFKKIVRNFNAILNGERVQIEVGYD